MSLITGKALHFMNLPRPGSNGRKVSFLFFILTLILPVILPAQVFFNGLEDSLYSAPWINVQLSDSGLSRSGNYSSVNTGMDNPFGLGIEMPFPENVRNKNTILKIEGWTRYPGKIGKTLFVITITENGKSWLWRGINLIPTSPEKSGWSRFSDSLLIPAKVTKNAVFKAYLWNQTRNDTIAIDDIRFEFSLFPNPSYIPDLKPEPAVSSAGNTGVLFKNGFYQIVYEPGQKRLSVLNKTGNVLINAIRYYSRREIEEDIRTDLPEWRLKTVKTKNDKTEILFEAGNGFYDLKMKMICRDDTPAIEFLINEKYKDHQEIIREALVLESNEGVTRVYRSNRDMDSADFQREYWLDREGLKFGNSDDSWLIYHVPGISSLQLSTTEKQLWVNLDYEKDHPFLHFPLNNDTTDEKIDWSESAYEKKAKRQYGFTLFAGIAPEPLPRFMKNPAGFEAVYIWTEHADFSDIRTNRAVYFGSETIENAEDATGGFVKYDIPVTKSVFYDNPDSVTNTVDSEGLFTSMECSILTEPAFLGFLEEVHGNGDEICLHTPENYTSSRKRMKKALRFMRDHFDSPTWIDHGYNNHLENNREDLVCDATLKESGNYLLKLWKKYNVRYFYNPYYEDYFTFSGWEFYDFLGKPFSGFGDFLPDPNYWRHPSRTGGIIHWPGKGALYAPRESDWDYYFNDRVLNEFIADRGVEINHCYPPRVNPEKGFWKFGSDSTVVAASGFNKTLERMAGLKKEGRLNVTTVQDFIDYQLALEKVKYEILPDGRIKVTNEGDKMIKDLSFVVRAGSVTVDGQKPRQKTVNEDIIFWFDLGPGKSKVITTTGF